MRSALILTTALLILAVAILGWAKLREARTVARESSQRALLDEIQDLLDQHYQKHGEYPDTLTVLPMTYPDGGTPKLVQDIEYQVTQDGYILRATGYHSRQVLDCSKELP